VVLRARRQQRWATAVHEAGHFLVAAFFGCLYESIGLEVSARVKMGVVVHARGVEGLSRTNIAAILAAGGLAQQRIGAPSTLGTGSDERQIADLRLSASAVRKARRRSAEILDLVWPDVELVAGAVTESNVLAGETVLAYVLAAQLDQSTALKEISAGNMTESYAAIVNLRTPRSGSKPRNLIGTR
jgi:hypothetical protein